MILPLRVPPRRRRTEQSRSRRNPTCGPAGSRGARAMSASTIGDDRLKRNGGRFEIVRLRAEKLQRADRGLRPFAIAPRSTAVAMLCRRRPSGKDRLGRQRHAGVDQQRRQLGQGKRSGKYLADAAHDAGARIEADRDIGAGRARRGVKVRIVARKAVRLGEQPQRRRRIGRTAAEPGRDRQSLVEVERRPRWSPGDARQARAPP